MAKIVTSLLVAWMVLSYGLIAVLASSSDSSPGGDRVVVTGERVATAAPGPSGVPAEHTERHARMTTTMRVTAPEARMPARMAGDPMWQMMYDPAHIRAEEEYHRQIDRMLARNP
ncbi:MAG TPA: hypothetical protein VM262_21330 [Acidimicrobiales bacterium]|nr:hypothetical protein [Acidimicrobiales bacterium]